MADSGPPYLQPEFVLPLLPTMSAEQRPVFMAPPQFMMPDQSAVPMMSFSLASQPTFSVTPDLHALHAAAKAMEPPSMQPLVNSAGFSSIAQPKASVTSPVAFPLPGDSGDKNAKKRKAAGSPNEEKKKRIRRPQAAQAHYARLNRKQVVEQFPDAPAAMITAKMTERWLQLSEAERAPYIAMEQDDRRRFDSEMAAVDATPSAPPVVHLPLPTPPRLNIVLGEEPKKDKAARPKPVKAGDEFDEVVVNGDRCMRVGAIFFRIHVQRPGRL